MFIKLWQKTKKPTAKHAEIGQESFDMTEVEEPIGKQVSKPPESTNKSLAVKRVSKAPKKIRNAAAKATLSPNEQALFERLKSLRMELARKNDKPAFQVFSDITLLDMVAKMPTSEAEMLGVDGVGKTKFARYGEDFLGLIANRGAMLNPNEQVLFERLKSLRMELARKIDKPAFVVFSNATLMDMIAKMPTNEAEMLGVDGVGKTKFMRYGEDFLGLFANRANDIKIELKTPDVLEGIAHYDYLINNIEQSQIRLIIMSGWITRYVVDDVFLRLIGKKLEQGIKIYIGYGFQDYKGNHKEIRGSKEVLISLQKLMKAYPSQLFIANFATHEKLLLVDSRRVVVGSANWLSNKNYINSERSLIIESDAFAKLEAARAIKLIKQNLTG